MTKTIREIVDNRLSIIRANRGDSTGTGSEQTIAHGLGAAPKRVCAYPTEDPAGTVFAWGSPGADATNIYITVTSGKDFTWIAETWKIFTF